MVMTRKRIRQKKQSIELRRFREKEDKEKQIVKLISNMPRNHQNKLLSLMHNLGIEKIEDFLKFRRSEFGKRRGYGPIFILYLKRALIWSGLKIDSDSIKEIELKIQNLLQSSMGENILRTRFEIFKRDNFKCSYCGRSPNADNGVILQIDHVHPRAKGGDWSKKNLITACHECNSGKSDILLDSYHNSK